MSKKVRTDKLLVRVFNQILSWEERSFKEMNFENLTLRELHIIEAVFELKEENNNRMSEIAKQLSITPGSLTTAVDGLVKKDYLARESKAGDRRVVLIAPTEKAREVNAVHSKIRTQMIDEILEQSGIEKNEVLYNMLEKLSRYFEEKKNVRE